MVSSGLGGNLLPPTENPKTAIPNPKTAAVIPITKPQPAALVTSEPKSEPAGSKSKHAIPRKPVAVKTQPEIPPSKWLKFGRVLYTFLTVCLSVLLLYTPPDSQWATSCLTVSDNDYQGLLTSCTDGVCTGWFQTGSVAQPDLDMLAAGQTAIALSILWIWIFLFSLVGLKKIRRKPTDSKAQQKKRKRWYRTRVPSYREIPRRAKTMVKSGKWLAISATFGICAAVAGLAVLKLGKGSSTLPGGGFYLCVILPFIALQTIVPEKPVKQSTTQKCIRTLLFWPITFPSLLICQSSKHRRKHSSKTSRV